MSCPCSEVPVYSTPAADTVQNCCPTAFCHDLLLSLPEAARLNVVGVRAGSKCLNVLPRTKVGFHVNDGKGGAIVTSQPQVPVPYLRTLLYDEFGQPILSESGNPEEGDPPGVDSLLVSGACGLQWRYRGRAGYTQKLQWDGCKWITVNEGSGDIDDYQSVADGREDCNYFPAVLIKQTNGSYKLGYRQTQFRFPGEIIPFAGALNAIPDDFLPCNGFSYDPADYPDLFAAIQFKWGNDDGLFRVPDLRGYFLRGVDHGEAVDEDAGSRFAKFPGGNSGDRVGTYQDDAFQCHEHDIPAEVAASSGTDVGVDTNSLVDLAAADAVHTQSVEDGQCGTARTADETRPKNASVEYIICAGCKAE